MRPSTFQLAPGRVLTATGEPWASVWHGNPLDTDFPRAPRMIAWSGWFGEGADPGSGAFPRDFRTWTPRAWTQLRQRLDAWSAAAAPPDALILRTQARHVLSDAQACALLLRETADERISLLLDPAGMLEPVMLRDADDHLARFLELAQHPRCSGVVIAGADASGERLVPAAQGSVLPRERVEKIVNSFAPAAARFFPVQPPPRTGNAG